jgi:hypothetical protein
LASDPIYIDDEEFAAPVQDFADISAWQLGLNPGRATWESLDMQSHSFSMGFLTAVGPGC